MGGFEIILVFIGLVWTIVSAIIQNKKKQAAKKQRALLIAKEQREEHDDDSRELGFIDASMETVTEQAETSVRVADSATKSPLQKLEALRARRIQQLRRRMGLEPAASPPAAPATVPPAVAPRSVSPPPATPRPSDQGADQEPAGAVEAGSMALPAWSKSSKESRLLSQVRQASHSRDSLRQAFLLKELLDPPLALRQEGV